MLTLTVLWFYDDVILPMIIVLTVLSSNSTKWVTCPNLNENTQKDGGQLRKVSNIARPSD